MASKTEKKHQQFIDEYFLCNMNQTEAYLRVYPKSSYDSARANAARLIADDNIQAEITARLKEKTMSADEALMRLTEQARGDLGEFTEVNLFADLKEHPKSYLVKNLTTDVYEDKNGKIHYKTRFELHNSQDAIRDILKIHGKFKDIHTNLNYDLSKATDEQLQRIAAGEEPAAVLQQNPTSGTG